ncbi:protein kinase family protein [Cohnella abietis]|uniref:Protein kinase domain-containing protein n=1 Tax=Cohnella abietis TaxID=2507935 RepID=A0A3T1D5S1_9BACL|nr:protein kinase family protein [Cohnella abietis]BBI33462.1 hypothetical protein KCTCHS21_28610 [Cohnella abietis]
MAIPAHEIDEYLRVLARKINAQFSNMKDASALFDDYYEGIESENLKQIFPLFHAIFNNSFAFINQKLSPGYGGHFNADPSRELIDVIEACQKLQANLKKSLAAFELDQNYMDLIVRCSSFLSKSGGSTIPADFPMIELIEHRAIFNIMNVVEVKSSPGKEAFQTRLTGGGSYAQVFKYKDPHYNRWFALKRAKADLSTKELQRFKNEYEITRKLNSPYIIEAYNYNNEKNEYTLEYANGGTLADYIRDNNTKLVMKDRLKLIGQLFSAFIYIHEKEILHRDISYHNILIHHFDKTWIVLKISDFGLVKIPESSLTSMDSSVKGSLNDPDLTKVGFANYEVRHEIYALAQVVNFILCGRKHGNGIYSKNQNVKKFLLKGLAADIDERFVSVQEMARAFQYVKNGILMDRGEDSEERPTTGTTVTVSPFLKSKGAIVEWNASMQDKNAELPLVLSGQKAMLYMGRNNPNGMKFLVVFDGEEAAVSLPINETSDYGLLEDVEIGKISIQAMTTDLNGDGNSEIVIVASDGIIKGGVWVFSYTKIRNKEKVNPFRQELFEQTQGKVSIVNNKITIPYGSQGLYNEYLYTANGVYIRHN